MKSNNKLAKKIRVNNKKKSKTKSKTSDFIYITKPWRLLGNIFNTAPGTALNQGLVSCSSDAVKLFL